MAKPPDHDVVLVNLGTPAAPTPEGVRAFLREFLSDPRVVDRQGLLWKLVLNGIVLRRRPPLVAKAYASIWTPDGSPLAAGTKRVSQALGAALTRRANVDWALRYGKPSIDDLIKRSVRLDRTSVTVVPLFPQRTGATTGTIEDRIESALTVLDVAGMRARGRVRLGFVPPDCPHYVAALAARCEEAFDELGGRPEHLVVSFHGIPVRYDASEDHGYSRACAATTGALLAALGWPAERASATWQSRFGREPWLEPATDATLASLARAGTKSVAVVCPGFLTEGLETLEEIGIAARKTFLDAGGDRYALVGAVEDHPEMIRSLAKAAGFELAAAV